MPFPDLDCLIAEVDRRCDTAHRAAGQEQPDWLALLAVATQLAGEVQAPADNLVEDYVEHCRMHGSSWTDIGAALGVTRQAVPRDDDRRPPPGDGPCEAGSGAAPQQLHRHRAPALGTDHPGQRRHPAPSSRRCLAGDAAPVRRSPAEHGRLPCSGASRVDALLSLGHRHRRGLIRAQWLRAQWLRAHRLRRPADRPCPGRSRSGRQRPDLGRFLPGRPRRPTCGHRLITTQPTTTRWAGQLICLQPVDTVRGLPPVHGRRRSHRAAHRHPHPLEGEDRRCRTRVR